MGLLHHVVSHYEDLVRHRLTVLQTQNQFDALVSFAYNPGGQLSKVLGLVNSNNASDAMNVLKSVNTSGGVVMRGLVIRRDLEVRLYENAEYN